MNESDPTNAAPGSSPVVTGGQPPREGRVIQVDGRTALRFERRYRSSIERVWRAVTSPEEMRRWFPSEVIGERTAGAALRFDDESHRQEAIDAGEPTRADGPEFTGRVIAFDPPHVFSFTWGSELLRIELFPDGDGTRLVFTQVLSHPSIAARNGAGWHVCLGELDAILDPDPVARVDVAATADGGGGGEVVDGDRADDGEADGFELYEEYVARIGPAPGVPGADGSMTWERGTHVEPEEVRRIVVDDLAGWGAADRAGEPLRWEVSGGDGATVLRLTHEAIGGDVELAATWHALLLQLDMYLAAATLIPADPADFVPTYSEVLGS